MKKFISGIITGLLIAFTVTAFAHPGALDSQGGHNKNADGTYHYHKENDRTTEYNEPQPGGQEAETKAPSAPLEPTPPESYPSTPAQIPDVYYNTNSIIYNGKRLPIKRPLITVTDETGAQVNYMPVRGVLESLGYVVGWDADTGSVMVLSVLDLSM
ncbi:MAG: copper amine oxidase N-terminal domain-containing protein [Clostridiales bacterium]|jgi:hypothetical protein|nr:copper amine oxidase N-terminal domain-containing protein [Clostridiales bacterium]